MGEGCNLFLFERTLNNPVHTSIRHNTRYTEADITDPKLTVTVCTKYIRMNIVDIYTTVFAEQMPKPRTVEHST